VIHLRLPEVRALTRKSLPGAHLLRHKKGLRTGGTVKRFMMVTTAQLNLAIGLMHSTPDKLQIA
jgi:hypothetical protein